MKKRQPDSEIYGTNSENDNIYGGNPRTAQNSQIQNQGLYSQECDQDEKTYTKQLQQQQEQIYNRKQTRQNENSSKARGALPPVKKPGTPYTKHPQENEEEFISEETHPKQLEAEREYIRHHEEVYSRQFLEYSQDYEDYGGQSAQDVYSKHPNVYSSQSSAYATKHDAYVRQQEAYSKQLSQHNHNLLPSKQLNKVFNSEPGQPPR